MIGRVGVGDRCGDRKRTVCSAALSDSKPTEASFSPIPMYLSCLQHAEMPKGRRPGVKRSLRKAGHTLFLQVYFLTLYSLYYTLQLAFETYLTIVGDESPQNFRDL